MKRDVRCPSASIHCWPTSELPIFAMAVFQSWDQGMVARWPAVPGKPSKTDIANRRWSHSQDVRLIYPAIPCEHSAPSRIE
jgi:hypothetical protein